MKLNKSLISTYVTLNSEKASAYLVDLATQMLTEIEAATTNEEIIEILDALKEFAFRAPGQAIGITDHVIRHQRETTWTEMLGHRFAGKTSTDAVIAAIELLDRIRYVQPDGILPLLAELMRSEEQTLAGRAAEVVKNFARYDFNILTKTTIGYGVQDKALKFIQTWPRPDQIRNLDFVLIVAEQLLGSSLEGTTMTTPDSVTIHSGALQPTPLLKSIRRQSIDLLVDLYKAIEHQPIRLKLIKTLEEAARTPSNVAYGDDLQEMVAADAEYLVGIYREMLFDSSGHLIGSMIAAQEIETRLYWLHRRFETAASLQLREDILRDRLYGLFHLLTGDPITFRGEDSWEEANRKRSDALDALVEEIREENVNEWADTLNRLCAESELIGTWQLHTFHEFLRRLASRKPDLAGTLLNEALEMRRPLRNFAVGLLNGLRDARRLDLWDSAVDQIPATGDPSLVATAAYSLNLRLRNAGDAEFRERDMLLLEDIVRRRGSYEFLDNSAANSNLAHSVINALVSNLPRYSERIEPLIIETFQQYPNWITMLLGELQLALTRDWITSKDFSENGVMFLRAILVELSDLDWDAQNLLLLLGRHRKDLPLDVFWQRIERDASKKEPESKDARRDYRAIPFDINDDLAKAMTEDPAFQDKINPWLDRLTEKSSMYNWNIGQFLQQMGRSFDEILRSLLQRGDEKSLTRAAAIIDCFDGSADVALCMEIVGRTDDSRIHDRIGAALYATGFVTGEDGLARAFETKASVLEPYLNSENPRIRSYAERMIDSLMASAKQERRRVVEEARLRQLEFEK